MRSTTLSIRLVSDQQNSNIPTKLAFGMSMINGHALRRAANTICLLKTLTDPHAMVLARSAAGVEDRDVHYCARPYACALHWWSGGWCGLRCRWRRGWLLRNGGWWCGLRCRWRSGRLLWKNKGKGVRGRVRFRNWCPINNWFQHCGQEPQCLGNCTQREGHFAWKNFVA